MANEKVEITLSGITKDKARELSMAISEDLALGSVISSNYDAPTQTCTWYVAGDDVKKSLKAKNTSLDTLAGKKVDIKNIGGGKEKFVESKKEKVGK